MPFYGNFKIPGRVEIFSYAIKALIPLFISELIFDIALIKIGEELL
jgi:hypothetical protein